MAFTNEAGSQELIFTGLQERLCVRRDKKCQQENHTLQRTPALHPMALEFALKDLPCSIGWIDVCYKCVRKFF